MFLVNKTEIVNKQLGRLLNTIWLYIMFYLIINRYVDIRCFFNVLHYNNMAKVEHIINYYAYCLYMIYLFIVKKLVKI